MSDLSHAQHERTETRNVHITKRDRATLRNEIMSGPPLMSPLPAIIASIRGTGVLPADGRHLAASILRGAGRLFLHSVHAEHEMPQRTNGTTKHFVSA